MAPPLFLIRAMLDTGAPVIFEGNWNSEHAKGWRFVMNMFITDVHGCMDTIKMAQIEQGRPNVTVGLAFNEVTMKPEAEPSVCGLYVKDLELPTLEDENAILEAENELLSQRIDELATEVEDLGATIAYVDETAPLVIDALLEDLENKRSQRNFLLQTLFAIQKYEGSDVDVPGLLAEAALRDWVEFED
jgi:hypothetical protein